MCELAAELAQAHPRTGHRLGMRGDGIVSTYVQRSIESFALTAARSQMRIDRMTATM